MLTICTAFLHARLPILELVNLYLFQECFPDVGNKQYTMGRDREVCIDFRGGSRGFRWSGSGRDPGLTVGPVAVSV